MDERVAWVTSLSPELYSVLRNLSTVPIELLQNIERETLVGSETQEGEIGSPITIRNEAGETVQEPIVIPESPVSTAVLTTPTKKEYTSEEKSKWVAGLIIKAAEYVDSGNVYIDHAERNFKDADFNKLRLCEPMLQYLAENVASLRIAEGSSFYTSPNGLAVIEVIRNLFFRYPDIKFENSEAISSLNKILGIVTTLDISDTENFIKSQRIVDRNPVLIAQLETFVSTYNPSPIKVIVGYVSEVLDLQPFTSKWKRMIEKITKAFDDLEGKQVMPSIELLAWGAVHPTEEFLKTSFDAVLHPLVIQINNASETSPVLEPAKSIAPVLNEPTKQITQVVNEPQPLQVRRAPGFVPPKRVTPQQVPSVTSQQVSNVVAPIPTITRVEPISVQPAKIHSPVRRAKSKKSFHKINWRAKLLREHGAAKYVHAEENEDVSSAEENGKENETESEEEEVEEQEREELQRGKVNEYGYAEDENFIDPEDVLVYEGITGKNVEISKVLTEEEFQREQGRNLNSYVRSMLRQLKSTLSEIAEHYYDIDDPNIPEEWRVLRKLHEDDVTAKDYDRVKLALAQAKEVLEEEETRDLYEYWEHIGEEAERRHKWLYQGHGIEIRDTPVGKGVFATRRIKPGTAITKYEGTIISKEQAEEESKKGNMHLLETEEEDKVIRGKDSSELNYPGAQLGSLVNHTPVDNAVNAEIADVTNKNGKHKFSFVVSVREIGKDEQILVHYGEKYWKATGKPSIITPVDLIDVSKPQKE